MFILTYAGIICWDNMNKYLFNESDVFYLTVVQLINTLLYRAFVFIHWLYFG